MNSDEQTTDVRFVLSNSGDLNALKGDHMVNYIMNMFKSKGENNMARAKLTKTEKVRNLFNTGASITWKTLRNKFDLTSPASMVGKLRNEGLMIYENRTSAGVSYRVGTPSKAVIAAGQAALFGAQGYSA